VKWISAEALAQAAPYKDIVEALRQGFREDIATPVRHHHETSSVTTLLLMPAWGKDFTGLKTVTVKTDNPALNVPTVQAAYLLIDNATGTPVVMMDGTELTRRRTAAAGALASDYLSRVDSSTLLIVGAGALAKHFVHAHASVRPIKTVLVYNRTFEKSQSLAQELSHEGFAASAVTDIETAVGQADIISGLTTSSKAIIKGAWLKPGTHIDLAGAFKPTMRETDGDAVKFSRVFVDTRHGAEAEAGDLIQAQAEGMFDFDLVQADLFELCKGTKLGRKTDNEITLFKSSGTALEDLATAVMVHLRQS
jgi:ornithine cyclodeaminase/alanine dehydrogenase-like protein (mu-crystallin family)